MEPALITVVLCPDRGVTGAPKMRSCCHVHVVVLYASIVSTCVSDRLP